MYVYSTCVYVFMYTLNMYIYYIYVYIYIYMYEYTACIFTCLIISAYKKMICIEFVLQECHAVDLDIQLTKLCSLYCSYAIGSVLIQMECSRVDSTYAALPDPFLKSKIRKHPLNHF